VVAGEGGLAPVLGRVGAPRGRARDLAAPAHPRNAREPLDRRYGRPASPSGVSGEWPRGARIPDTGRFVARPGAAVGGTRSASTRDIPAGRPELSWPAVTVRPRHGAARTTRCGSHDTVRLARHAAARTTRCASHDTLRLARHGAARTTRCASVGPKGRGRLCVSPSGLTDSFLQRPWLLNGLRVRNPPDSAVNLVPWRANCVVSGPPGQRLTSAVPDSGLAVRAGTGTAGTSPRRHAYRRHRSAPAPVPPAPVRAGTCTAGTRTAPAPVRAGTCTAGSAGAGDGANLQFTPVGQNVRP
jgi:hypothetical protein